MAGAGTPIQDTGFSPGDILVAAVPGGNYQVSRVAANGRSELVLGYQRTQPAALIMAARATAGAQRVFLRPDVGSDEYRIVESA